MGGWEQRLRLQCALLAPPLLLLLVLLTLVQCEELTQAHGGYKVASVSKLRDGTGAVANLKLRKAATDTFGPDIASLQVIARYEGEAVHVHITDATATRWEVPQAVILRPSVSNLAVSPPRALSSSSSREKLHEVPAPASQDGLHPLVVKYSVDPFGFSVTRRSDGEVLFDTVGSGELNSLVFKDQYLEISSRLPASAHLYGFGEVTRPDGLLLQKNRTFTLWATDIGSWNVDIPLYSTYPFLMDLRESAKAHGVLLLNSNGMDIRYENMSITYKVIGGVLDFYFFPGTTPLSVIKQLTSLVGRPAAFPYWAHGFHQTRYGYKNVEQLENVTLNYKKANLPMESMWTDIDHMDHFKDFTLDPKNYPVEKLLPYVESLHAHNQKFIMILDPNVKIDENYKTYVRGVELDIFLRNGSHPESRYIAQVWPGACNIPDFLHPNALQWWTREIREFHDVIPFDGLWLDMNEPANFCSGPNCYYEENPVCPKEINECCMVCDNNVSRLSRWDNPPYKINSFGEHRPLYVRTATMDSLHHDGSRSYDTHNIYGTTEALVTYKALLEVKKTRPFVLSRSGFFGASTASAHWTGDNGALWSELGGSVVSIMLSGFFGMPMVGADICGFNMITTEELCRRWILLGAFYPFSRSHSDKAATDQELYLWDSVREAAGKVLHWRYRLLPFWYTLQYEAHTTGAPYVRPLFFTFPEDPQTWAIDQQFMVGDAILVSPVLKENTTSVKAYFPRGAWHDLFGVSQPILAAAGPVWQTLPTPMDAINVHVRAGTIIPLQEFAMTTTEARNSPFTIVVAFAPAPEILESPASDVDREEASGHLYVDDDRYVEMKLVAGRATYVRFTASRIGNLYTLKSFVNESAFATDAGFVVDTVKVLGMTESPKVVYVNGKVAERVIVKVNSASSAIELSGFNHLLGTGMDIAWSTRSGADENLLIHAY